MKGGRRSGSGSEGQIDGVFVRLDRRDNCQKTGTVKAYSLTKLENVHFLTFLQQLSRDVRLNICSYFSLLLSATYSCR